MFLEEARKQKNKSQEEIAKEVGISRAGYSNIENGKRKPSVQVAKKIADVLGFDWTRFYEDEKRESA